MLSYYHDSSADIDAQDVVGLTPLHLAVQKGNKEIVNFLLNSDADVNTKDKDGKTAFDLALDQEIKHML